jgi:exodeoxyribonuclease VII large subunit
MTDDEGVLNPDLVTPARTSSDLDPWQVATLGQKLKEYIARLGTVWIEGELSQLSNRGSSLFAEIKDLKVDARVPIHSWNPGSIPADLKVGDRVVALVKPEFWPKSGKLSLVVYEIRKVGLGDLLERIERLRQLFVSEGLTDESRKQKIPFLPNRIGLITGKDSDAEKDVLQNVARRWADAQFRVINTKVQGDAAAAEVIAAVKALDADPEVDVIIIARGGGAFMDLVVFSDEALCRAVAACQTPVISAIGHEADSPLLDIVADLRASTPTDAAKKVVPDVAEERSRIADALSRMVQRIATFVATQTDIIAQLRSRPMLANPFGFIDDQHEELERELTALRASIGLTLERAATDLSSKSQMLRSLSPQSTLDRGYSVVRDETGHVLGDATKVKAGQKLNIRLAKGEITATADKN